MRNRALKMPSGEAVCAFCTVRLLRARSGTSGLTGHAIRRSIWSTATIHKPSEALQENKEDGREKLGWGAADRDANSGSWGSRRPPNRGSVSQRAESLGKSLPEARQARNIHPRREGSGRFAHDRKIGIRRVETSDGNISHSSNFRIRKIEMEDKPVRAPKESEYQADRESWNSMRDSSRNSLEKLAWPPKGDETQSQSVKNSNNSAGKTPERRQESVRERWKHIQFRQDESQERSENPDLQPFSVERKARFESATRGESVSWGVSDGAAWEHRFTETRQADADPSGQSERRAAKFGLSNIGDESKQDVGRGKKDRGSQRQRNRRNVDEDQMSDEALERLERREQRKERKSKKEVAPTPIILPDFISVGNLASVLRIRNEEFNTKLQELGFEDFSNDHVLGVEDAGLIAQEFNFEPTTASQEDTIEDITALPEPTVEEKELLLNRPPVVTIMGHVDHGKTTLLDFLRQSSVAAGEHGGITQHIGAFTVNMPSGRTITFLDTPGHAAFLDMRARGANVTDVVILVVAADDSVKPQTLEAIKHAKAAGVPMIVAISKVDKEEADADRVKRDLAQHGVEVEDFGGDVQAIPVSGKTGQGMGDLEESVIALADILDVRADTNGQAEGWVLESSVKPAGKVATVLVRRGTMKPGNVIVAGQTWAKIRSLRNEAGQVVHEATPGQPIEIDGWDELPVAGAEALQAPSLQKARQVAEYRQELAESEKLATDVAAANEQRTEQRQQQTLAKEQAQLEELKISDPNRAAQLQQALDLANANEKSRFIQVPLVICADVAGSVEALSAAVMSIGNTEIRAEVLRAEVGQISESDIELAATARGAIVNFGVAIDNSMRRMAEQEGVQIIDSNIIYRITDDVKILLEDKLPRIYTHKVVGEAEIAQVFEYTMKGKGKVPVAGCRVRNGMIEKAKNVKILRGKEVIFEGKLGALKYHKKDVSEIRKGSDCGMSFSDDFTAFQTGDQIQCFEVLEEKRTL